MPTQDKLFGLPITAKLAKKIIETTNKIAVLHKIDTLSDFHLVFRSVFDIYNGAYFNGDKLIQNVFKLLSLYTPYSKEFIIDSIATYYHDEGSKDIAVDYVQNHDFHNEDEISFIGKDMEERKRNAYEYYLEIAKKEISGTIHHHLIETLSPPVWVDKDVKYTPEERRTWLRKTILLMESFEFEDDDVNDEYFNQIRVLKDLIETTKYKTILKYTHRLSGNRYPYLFYIDIVNILYGIYNLKNMMTYHKATIKAFKHMLKDIEKESVCFTIENIIRDLTHFHEQVDFDQVERYVICYYYKYYIQKEKNFQDYKNFCGTIIGKNLQSLKENSFNFDKIKTPFQFLKFPTIWDLHKTSPMNQLFTLEQLTIIPEGAHDPFEGPAPTPKIK